MMTMMTRTRLAVTEVAVAMILLAGGGAMVAEAAEAATPPAAQPAPGDTVLGKLAASMKPGTFALLNQQGDGSGYSCDLVDGVLDGKGVGSIFGFAHKAAYDPVTDTVYFVGQAHDGAEEMIQYKVATNTWTNRAVPRELWRGHSQDTNSLNSAAREFYMGAHVQSTNMKRFNLDTQKWSTMSQPLSAGIGNGDPSSEYFPERDELLYVGGKAMAAWKRTTDSWKLVDKLPALGQRAPVARYNPVRKCVLIVGGCDTHLPASPWSHAVYKYDSEGKVTKLKDSPDSVKIYIGSNLMAADPISGDYILIQGVPNPNNQGYTRNIEFWKFDIAADTWTQLDDKIVPRGWWRQEGYPFGVVATPIGKHGVIMYMSSAGKVYIYKGVPRPAGG